MGELVQLKQSSNIVIDWLGQYKSEETIRGYKYSVEDFFDCGIENISDWKIKGVRFKDVQEYIKGLFNKGKSDNTIKKRIASLSSLFEYCDGIVGENPFSDKKVKKLLKLNMKKGEVGKVGKTISKEDIGKLLDRVDNKYERLLIGIMFKTGMRVSEVVEIKYNDIVEINEGKWLRVGNGKGRKVRFIPIKEGLIRDIEEYIKCYKVDGRLFKIGARRIDEILKKWIDLSCHDCRRSFAMNYIKNGGILTDLQRILGHDSLESTRKYLVEFEKFNKRMGDVIDW